MKTLIFCTSYIDAHRKEHSSFRYDRWIDFYRMQKERLAFDNMFLIDDGSKRVSLRADPMLLAPDNLPPGLNNELNMVSFENHLGRASQLLYKGWWRSFTFSLKIALQYSFKKIIHIESDFYIVSDRLLRFLKDLDTGWTTLFSRHHQFPESGIQVICEDEFASFLDVYDNVVSNKYAVPLSAERYLPFTNVVRSFSGDRLGQVDVLNGWLSTNLSTTELDYIGQVLPYFDARDFDSFFKFKYLWGDNVRTSNNTKF